MLTERIAGHLQLFLNNNRDWQHATEQLLKKSFSNTLRCYQIVQQFHDQRLPFFTNYDAEKFFRLMLRSGYEEINELEADEQRARMLEANPWVNIIEQELVKEAA